MSRVPGDHTNQERLTYGESDTEPCPFCGQEADRHKLGMKRIQFMTVLSMLVSAIETGDQKFRKWAGDAALGLLYRKELDE